MSWMSILKMSNFGKFIEEEFAYSNAVFDPSRYDFYINFDVGRKVREAKQRVLKYFDNLHEKDQEEIALAINMGDSNAGSVNEFILYSAMIGLMAKALGLHIKEVVEGFNFSMIYDSNARAIVESANI